MKNTLFFNTSYFEPSILKCPNGKFKFVGTLPMGVLEKKINKIGQTYYDSPIFEQYEQAKNYFLIKTGKNIK